jgi:zinc transport system substrate-binding protein
MTDARLKRLIRRWSMALLAGSGLVAGWGCGRHDSPSPADRLVVAVSILPQVEFAQRIGGDRVSVVPVIPPGANPHTYEPAPGQLAALSRARAYAVVGSGLPFEETWAAKLRGVNPGLQVIDCSVGIATVAGDPHVWASPRLAATMVRNLCAGLVMLDPAHRTDYEINRDRYLDTLAAVDAELTRTLAPLKGQRFMVYHPSWGYLARDYGLVEIAIEDEGKEPTIGRLSSLIDEARRQRIGTVFVSPQFDDRSARALATELGIGLVAIDGLAADYVANVRRIASQWVASR